MVKEDNGGKSQPAASPADWLASPVDPAALSLAPDRRPADMQPAWRQDFPIDYPEDHHVARRDFVKFLTLTSLAFAVGQLWIAMQSRWRKLRGLPPALRIGSAADVAPGASIPFQYPGVDDDAILTRTKEGELVAYSRQCTHLSCAVIPKPETGTLRCPCHEGCFDLKSGRPLSGPPRRPLDRIVVDVREGAIWAVGVERRTV